MKNWQRPAAVGQKFAANDYVSACSIKVSCDFVSSEFIRNGGLVIPDSVEDDFAGGEYRPCKHEFVVGVDELKEVTFTHHTGSYSGNDPLTTPQTAYYWIEGDNEDFHATSVSPEVVKDALENGKS